MAKGTTAAQNIALLRYAKATGLLVQWNLLHGFPNDEPAFYDETLELMPLLHHLQPPVSPCPVVIDRFSPYFERPGAYGVEGLRPFGFYRGVYGDEVPLAKLAYHFEGTYPSVTRDQPGLVKQLSDAVAAWRRRFYGPVPPRVVIERAGTGYRLTDTRGLTGVPVEQHLDEAHAIAATVTRAVRAIPAALASWVLEHRLAVARDGKLIALAVAEPDLLHELESRASQPLGELRVVS